MPTNLGFRYDFLPYKRHQNLLRLAYCFQQSYLLLPVGWIGREGVDRRFECPLDL
jgi:hypothetical protein